MRRNRKAATPGYEVLPLSWCDCNPCSATDLPSLRPPRVSDLNVDKLYQSVVRMVTRDLAPSDVAELVATAEFLQDWLHSIRMAPFCPLLCEEMEESSSPKGRL